MGSKLKFEAFVILQNSLKFSIGEEGCPETVAGDYIRVTHPHCVSVVKFVIAESKVEREEIKPEKILKEGEQII